MKFNTSKVATIFLKNKFVGNKKSDVRENDGFIFMFICETKTGHSHEQPGKTNMNQTKSPILSLIFTDYPLEDNLPVLDNFLQPHKHPRAAQAVEPSL